MRIIYPKEIHESDDELRRQEQQLRGTKVVDRVRMLRLLKSGQAATLQAVGELLGYSRVQVTRWWEQYHREGLAELLVVRSSPGRPTRLTEAARAGIHAAMKRGEIATLKDAQRYLREQWQIHYASLNGIWRQWHRERTRKKTGRPRHRRASTKKQEEFRDHFAQHLTGMQRVMACDEGRFGLKSWHRRRWCPHGVRPPWLVDDQYQWLWVYVAVEPSTGVCVVWFLPSLQSASLTVFLQQLRQELGDARIGLVLDNAPSHHSHYVSWPAGISPLYLPPYSPELDPVEQVFRHLRQRLSNSFFATMEELQAALTTELRALWEHPQVLIQLTNYPWWQAGVNSIAS
jgi:transposase